MQDPNIDHGVRFDWGRASADYARYRDIYPPAFYDALISRGLCTAGQRVLDLGTGTGVLPRALYRYGADFTGVDAAPAGGLPCCTWPGCPARMRSPPAARN